MLIAITIAEEIQGLQISPAVISENVGDVHTEYCCYFGHGGQEGALESQRLQSTLPFFSSLVEMLLLYLVLWNVTPLTLTSCLFAGHQN